MDIGEPQINEVKTVTRRRAWLWLISGSEISGAPHPPLTRR